MKKFLLTIGFLFVLAIGAQAQSGCVELREIDGTPDVKCVKIIRVTNGTLSCTGTTCTITISGGGGGSPGGSDTQLQYNNSGSFGGITGATTNGTVVTLTNALATTAFSPSSNDGAALGSGTASFSDLFLASGALINFANGNAVITHSSGIITVSTGDLRVTTAGTNTASAVTVGGTQTLTNKTLASPSVTGNISAEATSLLFFGGNYYRYINGTGPATYDVTTDNVLTFNVQSLTGNRTVTWPDVAGNVALTTGALTSGNCAEFDASGRIVDSGGACGGGGGITVGTTTVTSGTATRLFYETAGNVVGQVSGVTSDGTNVTAGSGNLRATSPRITTGINDANGNESILLTATASAVNEITIANAATGNSPNISATGDDANIGLTLTPKGSGNVLIASGLLQFGGTTASFPALKRTATYIIARLANDSGNANLSASLFDATNAGLSGSGFFANNSTGYYWASVIFGSKVLGIERQADAVARITNGSTGAGSLVLGTSTVGSIGTSGVGVLAIANGTAPTSSPADEFQLYSADSAAGDANAFARNEAGEVNRLTGLSARNSSSFAKTSDTTLANITGLTRNVEAGRTYYFETELSTTSANTGGVKFAISGTATATAIDYEGVLRDGTTISAATRATALDTTVCAVTAVTAATCRIRGVIVVNAAGTLTVQFAQNASDGSASTVLVNQAFSLRPIS